MFENTFSLDFEPLFAIMTKSRYENKFILRNSLTQQAALRDIVRDDPDVVQGIDDYESKTSPVNPCSFEYIFYGIHQGLPILSAVLKYPRYIDITTAQKNLFLL